ncbi:MAG: hypothetical protein NTU51_11565 [Bacteroidetes bacterium]|nr:hypothetical protein [Bacteroidota bacterium]
MRPSACCLLLFLFLALSHPGVRSQGLDGLRSREKELKEAFGSILPGETDSLRLAFSKDFQEQLRSALFLKGSADYPWDSLKHVAKIESPDGSFRLYNWNVPMTGGGNRYFCMLQFKGILKNLPAVALTDKSDSIPGPEYCKSDSLHWYGSLYYKVIPFDLKNKQKAYILLGWNGISSEISGKIIEVLTFPVNGVPVFGSPVFPDYMDGRQLRILFRFASTSGMSLRYQLQTIPSRPVWNSRKKEYTAETRSQWMIIFDHLVPMDPQLEGQYKFYVPASETAEGFFYENYHWNYVKEFDARNP